MSVIEEKVKVRDENLTLVLVHFSEEAEFLTKFFLIKME